MKNTIYLFLFVLVIACNTNSKEADEKKTTNADETWKGFWTLLQQAVEEDDKEMVKSLCSFDYGITENNFTATYEMFFTAEMKKLILSTPSEEVRMENPSATDEVLHSRVCNLYEEGQDEDGNTYESALMFYVGKIKKTGKYRIYLFLAAG